MVDSLESKEADRKWTDFTYWFNEVIDEMRISARPKCLDDRDIFKRIGISQSSFSKLKNGLAPLSVNTAHLIGQYFVVSVEYLLELDGREDLIDKFKRHYGKYEDKAKGVDKIMEAARNAAITYARNAEEKHHRKRKGASS